MNKAMQKEVFVQERKRWEVDGSGVIIRRGHQAPGLVHTAYDFCKRTISTGP